MSKLTDKAEEIADLLDLSAEIGVSASVRENDGIYISSAGDAPDRKIGSTVSEAVRYLKSITANAGLRPRDGQRQS